MSLPLPLLELSPELILTVADNLNYKDLNSLLQCNRYLSRLLAPLLRKIALAPKDGHSPLGWAMIRNSEPLARLVLENRVDVGADVDTVHARTATHKGHIVLCWAAIRGHNRVIELLLEKGADVITACPCTVYGDTVIIKAIRCGNEGVVRALLGHGALLDPVIGLSWAMWSGNDAIMRYEN